MRASPARTSHHPCAKAWALLPSPFLLPSARKPRTQKPEPFCAAQAPPIVDEAKVKALTRRAAILLEFSAKGGGSRGSALMATAHASPGGGGQARPRAPWSEPSKKLKSYHLDTPLSGGSGLGFAWLEPCAPWPEPWAVPGFILHAAHCALCCVRTVPC